jgi:uncharacterized DUF497 family protein
VDAEKAVPNPNLAKHGVAFEEAVTVFLDLDYLLVRDELEPDRFVSIGMSSPARVLFVVHCERGRVAPGPLEVAGGGEGAARAAGALRRRGSGVAPPVVGCLDRPRRG